MFFLANCGFSCRLRNAAAPLLIGKNYERRKARITLNQGNSLPAETAGRLRLLHAPGDGVRQRVDLLQLAFLEGGLDGQVVSDELGVLL